MSILQDVYQTSAEVKALFYKAEQEKREHGVLTDETAQAIDRAQRDRDHVVSELAHWYLYTESKLAGLKAEYQPILDKIQADLKEYEDKLKFIKGCFFAVLPPSKEAQVANERAYVYYRESAQIEVDEARVPIDFIRVVEEPDKKAIKEALQNGLQCDWARLRKEWSPQIKLGGINAMKNAKNRLKKIEKGEGE